MLSTIGGGLIYSFDIGTPASKFIGYQVVAGAGIGLAIQVPIIVAQATSSRADLSIAMSTMLCKSLLDFCFSYFKLLLSLQTKLCTTPDFFLSLPIRRGRNWRLQRANHLHQPPPREPPALRTFRDTSPNTGHRGLRP
jgi:hypothetical protein